MEDYFDRYKRLIDERGICVTKVIAALRIAIRNKEVEPTHTIVRLLEDLDQATQELDEFESQQTRKQRMSK